MKNTSSLETIIESKQALPTISDLSSPMFSFKDFTKTEDDVKKFTNYLISLAGEISPEEEKLLFYFFQTTLNYLREFYYKDDINLRTFALLTEFLEKDASCKESLYDQLIKESLQKAYLRKAISVRTNYKILLEIRDDKSPKIIKRLFWNIFENYQPPKK